MINALHYLQSHPTITFIFVSVLGLVIGSFLNVVIYRLPKILENEWTSQCRDILNIPPDEPPALASSTLTLSAPNSTCPDCGHEIRPWENIPVLSYLFLRGKCSSCKNPISIRYPVIELVTGILSLATVCLLGINAQGVAALPLVWALIALTMIDIDTQLLPDNITLPFVWLGLIVNAGGVFTSLDNALWGAVAGYLSLWTVYQGFRLLTGKEGMGFGDFKLLAVLGAWMGWQLVPLIIILSSFVGAAVGICLILFLGKDKNIPIPFGPYLAIAGWIALVWGHDIIRFYLSSFAPLSA
ncbi:MAG: prepilin peptidase [Gammaproteobacteria bacterium]|nr:MAG: prepilin peptidase [Pseudomonadota bacterium]PIE38232.1 MAG: prepilin peptidase [Gammaproteobacteria bacterium]